MQLNALYCKFVLRAEWQKCASDKRLRSVRMLKPAWLINGCIEVLHVTSLIAFHRKSTTVRYNNNYLCYSSKIMALWPNMLCCGWQEPRMGKVSFYHNYIGSYRAPGRKTFELSSKRRQEWIARINRKDWVP